jgi:hypothetical protein
MLQEEIQRQNDELKASKLPENDADYEDIDEEEEGEDEESFEDENEEEQIVREVSGEGRGQNITSRQLRDL